LRKTYLEEKLDLFKKMLNQRPNSDGDLVLPTERTYTHTIYATRTHHYILIHQHFACSHA